MENNNDIEMSEDESDSSNDDSEREEATVTSREHVYVPGHALGEGEELTYDESAYIMYHRAQTGSPCLSFDIIHSPQTLQDQFPMTAYVVSGTQAPQSHANSIIVMKLSNMGKTQPSEESDESDEESEEETEDESKTPKLLSALINHPGCVNRVRSTVVGNSVLAASWSELGRVVLWDLTSQLQAVDNDILLSRYKKNNLQSSTKPLFTFKGHQSEGFGLDWSPTKPGVLASGDCRTAIHIWQPAEGGIWHVDQRPLVGHVDSVEDLQWSPNEANVLASCSVDKSIRIWDTRSAPKKACKLTVENAHERDVNVINWNRSEPLIVSGGDDGFLHVWDLRNFNIPVATFKHHTDPITTVEWHPTDSTVFASGGGDNQIVLWDIAVEQDTENDVEDIRNLPGQLLFIHQGQADIKELHWHPQNSGVLLSTALNGFNIFKTISV